MHLRQATNDPLNNIWKLATLWVLTTHYLTSFACACVIFFYQFIVAVNILQCNCGKIKNRLYWDKTTHKFGWTNTVVDSPVKILGPFKLHSWFTPRRDIIEAIYYLSLSLVIVIVFFWAVCLLYFLFHTFLSFNQDLSIDISPIAIPKYF